MSCTHTYCAEVERKRRLKWIRQTKRKVEAEEFFFFPEIPANTVSFADLLRVADLQKLILAQCDLNRVGYLSCCCRSFERSLEVAGVRAREIACELLEEDRQVQEAGDADLRTCEEPNDFSYDCESDSTSVATSW